MKKSTILKKLDNYEERIIKIIDEMQDFLDSVDDSDVSVMAEDFCQGMLDYVQENGICNLNDIREFIENDYETEL
jgi:hypothetical protein